MQTLEGPEMAVKSLVEKIRSDARHHHFNILMEGSILERSFSQWTMGFKRMTGEPLLDERGYFDSDDLSLMSRQFLQHPPASLGAFLSFQDEA
jgi:hypothetical protein